MYNTRKRGLANSYDKMTQSLYGDIDYDERRRAHEKQLLGPCCANRTTSFLRTFAKILVTVNPNYSYNRTN